MKVTPFFFNADSAHLIYTPASNNTEWIYEGLNVCEWACWYTCRELNTELCWSPPHISWRNNCVQPCMYVHPSAALWLSCIFHFPFYFSCIYNASRFLICRGGGKAENVVIHTWVTSESLKWTKEGSETLCFVTILRSDGERTMAEYCQMRTIQKHIKEEITVLLFVQWKRKHE